MLNEKIKYLRLQDGLSQQELADALGVQKSTISNWENDHSVPSYEKLKEIAKYFSVSLDYLLDFDYDDKELEEFKALVRNVDKVKLEQALKIVQMLETDNKK